jgi:hypothetical protein
MAADECPECVKEEYEDELVPLGRRRKDFNVAVGKLDKTICAPGEIVLLGPAALVGMEPTRGIYYKDEMPSRTPPRNRLAKPLPEEWRKVLISHGVPKRKYTAVCRATLAGGRLIDELIVEEGWIIALSKKHLAGIFEERIDFDPRLIMSLEIVQVA